MLAYNAENDKPEDYQEYRRNIWPVMREIVESYHRTPAE
jgi:hypothetical protein